jgi:hypothetical protein
VGFGTVATAGIANAAITLAKMANLAANSILGNNTGAGATPLALTAAQVKTLLAIAQADVAGLLTSSSPQFAGIELGNASDTSLTRLAAGVLGVEGKTVNVWDGVIVKSATESRTSTAVLANDADFAAALTSGKMYYIEFLLLYDSPVGGGTPDMNLACGEDATGRGIFQRNGWSTGDAANTNEFIANQTATTGLGTATTPRSAIIRGTYVSGGGTFRLLWCQAVSGANPSRILAGSQMRYQLIG